MSGPTSTKTQSDLEPLVARAFFYKLLAAWFRHPESAETQEFIEETSSRWQEIASRLKSPLTTPLSLLMGREVGEGHINKERVKETLGQLLKQYHETTRGEWVNQYERCFGHTAHSRVPAYELEHGEEHSHRQPQELADIAAFYQAFGLQVSGKNRERADHISVECEFMYYLLYKEAYAVSGEEVEKVSICREASQHFFSQHLGYWVPAFLFRLSKVAGADLLKRVACFALAFIFEESDALDAKTGREDLPIRMIQEKEETGCVSCLH